MTATQVRTTALWALSAKFMYHFTYGFCGFGGTRRCFAAPKAKRADMGFCLRCVNDTGSRESSGGRSAEIEGQQSDPELTATILLRL